VHRETGLVPQYNDGVLYRGDVNRRSFLVAGPVLLMGCASRPHIRPQVADAVPDESILRPLFEAGTEFELTVGGRAPVKLRDAGELNLPSGEVIASDPSWLPSWQRLDIAPYTVAVPPGRYPVSLAVLNLQGADLVAGARLAVSDRPVVAWEGALRPGEDPASLQPGEYFGVGVDIANAGFMDAVALPYMAEQEDKGGEDFRVLMTQLSAQRTDPSTGANYIAFNTGYGDGHYPVWIGRAEDSSVACFVMDMLICRMPKAA
jgi:hypothetical protein